MRRIGMLLAACVLAACGGKGSASEDAPPSAPGPPAEAAERRGTADSTGVADTAYAFRLHEARPGVVDSITVTRGGRAVQTLRPSENQVPPGVEVPRVSRVDLDFDGHADLGLVTELSMASSRSEYWRLDPRAGRFEAAGVRETLQPDSAAREHTSFNRGGHAGRLWTASRWRWMDGALAEVRREEQDLLPDGERYVRVVHERREGVLAETARDTLEEAEVRGSPSWMEP